MGLKEVDPDGVRPRGTSFGLPRSMSQSSGRPSSSLCFPVVRGRRAISSVSPESQPGESSLPSRRFSSWLSAITGDGFEVLAASEVICWPRSRRSTPESAFELPAVEVDAPPVRGFLWKGSVGTVSLVDSRLRLLPDDWDVIAVLTGVTVRCCPGAH